jgi:DNA-binding Xre family transcriptional regulator
MKRVIIIDRGLMAQRLRQKMIEKGYVHKAGTPHQKMLAEAIGDTKIQPTISSILRQENESLNEEYLTALCQALNCQEQWLLGGDYVPLQEKPLFKEELYQPEEKVPEKAENELLKALWGIVRQLQLLNRIKLIDEKAHFIWLKNEQEELIRLGGIDEEDLERHRRLTEIFEEAYQNIKKLEEKRNG